MDMSPEQYTKSLEMLVCLLCYEKTVAQVEDMLKPNTDDETINYAIALIAIVLKRAYEDFLLDTMEPEGKMQ